MAPRQCFLYRAVATTVRASFPRTGRCTAKTLRPNHPIQRSPGSQATMAQPYVSHIANEHNFYDQMHLVHDCTAFTGEPLHDSWPNSRARPSSIRFLRLKTVCDTGKSLRDVAFLLSRSAANSYHPSVTSLLHVGAVGLSECARAGGRAGLTSAPMED